MTMATAVTTDRIEKQIVIAAPRSRVWRALTTSQEFARWFGAAPTTAFVKGTRVSGPVTLEGWEHVTFEVTIERLEPERYFSWRWHPHTTDPKRDYSQEPSTLVEFELREVEGGTLLTVVESGFDGIPFDRRAEAFRGNAHGWAQQMQNISAYVTTDVH